VTFSEETEERRRRACAVSDTLCHKKKKEINYFLPFPYLII